LVTGTPLKKTCPGEGKKGPGKKGPGEAGENAVGEAVQGRAKKKAFGTPQKKKTILSREEKSPKHCPRNNPARTDKREGESPSGRAKPPEKIPREQFVVVPKEKAVRGKEKIGVKEPGEKKGPGTRKKNGIPRALRTILSANGIKGGGDPRGNTGNQPEKQRFKEEGES